MSITKTNYRGSVETFARVKAQIAERFGETEAEKYDPEKNCRTFNDWLRCGFQVKRGSKAIRSFIILESKDKNGRPKKYVKTISLFYKTQVRKITA